MSRQIIEIVVATLVFVASSLGFRHASQLPGRSGAFPEVIMAIAMLLCAVWIIQQIVSHRKQAQPAHINYAVLSRAVTLIVLSGLYVLAVPTVGFFSATVLFIPIASAYLGYRNWAIITATTAGFILILYVVFLLVLKTPLPPEIIMRLV